MGISGAEFGAVTRWATTPNPARLKLVDMLHVARTPDASGLALQRAGARRCAALYRCGTDLPCRQIAGNPYLELRRKRHIIEGTRFLSIRKGIILAED